MIPFLKNYNIILASNSPRRQELMRGMDIEFTVPEIIETDETVPVGIGPEKAAEYLAIKKAKAYTNLLTPKTIIITADTIVICNKEMLSKPSDKNEATKFLRKLSGRKHKVITGVYIATIKKNITFSTSTNVFFCKLNEKEIEYYVEKYRPYDKAGAYGVQEWIGYIGIEKISGSYFNVVGFPTQALYNALRSLTERTG